MVKHPAKQPNKSSESSHSSHKHYLKEFAKGVNEFIHEDHGHPVKACREGVQKLAHGHSLSEEDDTQYTEQAESVYDEHE